jgi:hypothetical protein
MNIKYMYHVNDSVGYNYVTYQDMSIVQACSDTGQKICRNSLNLMLESCGSIWKVMIFRFQFLRSKTCLFYKCISIWFERFTKTHAIVEGCTSILEGDALLVMLHVQF